MRSDGNKRALPADVLMQFVLKVDERVVASFIEMNAAEHGAHYKWTDEQRFRTNHLHTHFSAG